MFTNIPNYGGKLLDLIDKTIKSSTDVVIASGYVSFDILNRYKDDFLRIAGKGGRAKLLLGMAFYEGLSINKLTLLNQLSKDLSAINVCNGVFVTFNRRFHGKIYKFSKDKKSEIFLGSSNFSRSGLSENIEATAQIEDPETKNKINHFLDFLFSKENAVPIDKAEIAVPGTASYRQRLSLETLDDLKRYNPDSINKTAYPFFDFPLSRIAEKEKSNLNVYFGKGRWNRSTGRVSPRPWYEVELIADSTINRNPLYPQGDFLGFTDDGFIIQMKSSGDYYKNIRSKGNLCILGQWIKGKLQKKEALIPLTPVTQDVLDLYGKDTIRFYKIGEKNYFMEF